MQGIIPALQEAIATGLVTLATQRNHKKKLLGMGVLALSGLVFIIALVFLALAAYRFLSVVYTPAVSFLVIGLGLFLLGLMFFIIGRVLLREREIRNDRQAREEIVRMLDIVTNDVEKGLVGPIRDNPKTSLAAALLAGFVTGEKIL